MIHMLSRFDLKPGTNVDEFKQHYESFMDRAKLLGLAASTGTVGKRVADTPMDTDAEDAPEYYVVMSFRDREQMDRAYAYMEDGGSDPSDLKPHSAIKFVVRNAIFTCWQD